MIGLAEFVWTSSTGAKSISNPSARELVAERPADLLGDRLVLGRREPIVRGHRGPPGRRPAHPLHHAAFLIDRDQRGRAVRRAAMKLAGQRDQRVEIARLVRAAHAAWAAADHQVSLEHDRRADLAAIEPAPRSAGDTDGPGTRPTAAGRHPGAARSWHPHLERLRPHRPAGAAAASSRRCTRPRSARSETAARSRAPCGRRRRDRPPRARRASRPPSRRAICPARPQARA